MSRHAEDIDEAADEGKAGQGPGGFLPDQGNVRVRRGGAVVLTLLIGLVVVAGALYLGAYLMAGDRIAHGTHISGVDVGGMKPAAAEAKLRKAMTGRAKRPIKLSYQDAVRSTTASDAGLSIDYHGSVKAAGGGGASLSPGRLWDHFFGGDDVDARVLVDEPRLQAAIARFSTGVGLPVSEGTIGFRDGKATPVYSKPGLGVDSSALVGRMKKAFLMRTTPAVLPVPTATVQPVITADAVRQAMRDFAQPAMSAPIVLEIGSQRVTASPKQFSAALSMVPSGRALVPVVDGPALLKALQPVMPQFADKPVDARLVSTGTRPRVVPSKVGLTVNIPALEDGFAEAVARPDVGRELVVQAALRQPAVPTSKIRALKVDRRLGEQTVQVYPQQAGALRRAAAKLDGKLIQPGATFDVRATLGPLAAASGGSGQRGGVDAAATAAFAAAYDAGFADAGHTLATTHRAWQPVGREVTLGAGAPLAFTNTSSTAAMITARVSGDTILLRIWGHPYGTVQTSVSPRYGVQPQPMRVSAAKKCRPAAGKPGYTVRVSRSVTRAGATTPDSYEQTYQPVSGVTCTR